MTPAQKLIGDTLRNITTVEKGYRTAAMLVTYPSSKPGADCQIAMGVAMGEVTPAHARDFVLLVRGLRRLADELEARIEGRVPFTQEIKDG